MNEPVKITVVDNEAEAQAIGVALDEADVPHIIRSYYDSAYDGLFQSQKGWGCIMAAEADRARAERIIADVRAQAAERGEEP